MSRNRPIVRTAQLGCLCLAVRVLGTIPAQAAFPGRNGKIAFTRDIGTNAEVFT